jgi:hypothetical protein
LLVSFHPHTISPESVSSPEILFNQAFTTRLDAGRHRFRRWDIALVPSGRSLLLPAVAGVPADRLGFPHHRRFSEGRQSVPVRVSPCIGHGVAERSPQGATPLGASSSPTDDGAARSARGCGLRMLAEVAERGRTRSTEGRRPLADTGSAPMERWRERRRKWVPPRRRNGQLTRVGPRGGRCRCGTGAR